MLPFCSKVKQLVEHVLNCKNEISCFFTCIITRRVISHFDSCRDPTCERCAIIKGNTLNNTLEDYAECIRYQMILFCHSDMCLRNLIEVNEENTLFVS